MAKATVGVGLTGYSGKWATITISANWTQSYMSGCAVVLNAFDSRYESVAPSGVVVGGNVDMPARTNGSIYTSAQVDTTKATIVKGNVYHKSSYESYGTSSYLTLEKQSDSSASAPGNFTSSVNPVKLGSQTTISWNASSSNFGAATGYKLERKIDNGDWQTVQIGGSRTYSCTFNEDDFDHTVNTSNPGIVTFRVSASNSDGVYGSYSTLTISVVPDNALPTPIGLIMINDGGEIIRNKTFVIQWSESVDTDGTIEKYVLQRKLGSDGEWTNLYQGTALSFNDKIIQMYDQVSYRIKSVDNQGGESPYIETSTTMSLNENPSIELNNNYGMVTAPPTILALVTDPNDDTMSITCFIDEEEVLSIEEHVSGDYVQYEPNFSELEDGDHIFKIVAICNFDESLTAEATALFTKYTPVHDDEYEESLVSTFGAETMFRRYHSVQGTDKIRYATDKQIDDMLDQLFPDWSDDEEEGN